jgi:pilus assembly protein Flp/PilA
MEIAMLSLFIFLTSTLSHYVDRGMQFIRRDERGLEAVEYALIAALLAVAIVVAVQTLGGTIAGVFTNLDTKIKAN